MQHTIPVRRLLDTYVICKFSCLHSEVANNTGDCSGYLERSEL